jgi:hypothetical protein
MREIVLAGAIPVSLLFFQGMRLIRTPPSAIALRPLFQRPWGSRRRPPSRTVRRLPVGAAGSVAIAARANAL